MHLKFSRLSHFFDVIGPLFRKWPRNPPFYKVYIEAGGGPARIVLHGPEILFRYEIPAEGDLSASIPAEILIDEVKKLKKHKPESIGIEVVGSTILLIETEGRRFERDFSEFSGSKSISFEGPSEFRWLADWPRQEFFDSLDFVSKAASRDTGLDHLTTLHFDAGQMLATDGHRLHMAPLPEAFNEIMTVPSEVGHVLKKAQISSKRVLFERGQNTLRMTADPWQLVVRLRDPSRFPAYERLFDKRNSYPIIVGVENSQLKSALRQLQKQRRRSRLIMTIDQKLCLEHEQNEFEKLQIPIERFDSSSEEMSLGIDSKYLKEAIDVPSKRVELCLCDPLAPIRIDLDGGKMAIVMPVRL